MLPESPDVEQVACSDDGSPPFAPKSLASSRRALGHGQLDHSALFLLVEQLFGRAPSSPTPDSEARP